MRTLSALFVLLLAAPLGAQDIEGDGRERKKDDRARDVKQAWDAYLKRLDKGPVYRVEILHRSDNDGPLFLLETMVSSTSPQPWLIRGVGLNLLGRPIPPPDPGKQRIKEAMKEVSKSTAGDAPFPLFPLAEATSYVGVSLRRNDAGAGNLMIRTSDVATSMKLPEKVGSVSVAYFRSAGFRVERLSAEALRAAQPLCQDRAYVRDRIAALRRELLTTHRAAFQSDHALCSAVGVLRDPALVGRVRQSLSRWIDRAPAEVEGKGFPSDLAYALARVGGLEDIALFHRLARRHPRYASHAVYPYLLLLRRCPLLLLPAWLRYP